jgi:hypothetical protein
VTNEVDFVEKPRLEWHNKRPFAIARLPTQYAHALAQIALDREEFIKSLPVSEDWQESAVREVVSSRYQNYNALVLSLRCVPLFVAIRSTYRYLLGNMEVVEKFATLQCWVNIHRKGQHLTRHLHGKVPLIGAFIARGEGSTTSYGPSPVADERDHAFENRDGRLLITWGGPHYHEVSTWEDSEHPRVSYGFNINFLPEEDTNNIDKVMYPHLIPFDGPGFST